MNAHFGSVLLALVLAQSAFLGAMIWDRVSLLRSGVVVTLKTEPVDPRDLFRGDYVILNYAISSFTLGDVAGDRTFASGDDIYVELAPGDETWNPVAVWRAWREPAEGNRIIRGSVSYVWEDERTITANVSYGIESYFVPEGEGRELEHSRNAGMLSVDVALGGDGTPAIKGLRLDGKPVYEEPLF